MLQQERAYLLSVHSQRLNGRRTGANEISHRFVTGVRNPHGRQLAGSEQPS